MDDFNNSNNLNNEPENNGGTLNGFDSANMSNNDNGYTVTPDGGFYTKKKDDIIQDDIYTNSSHTEFGNDTDSKTTDEPVTPPPPNSEPVYHYSANTNYGYNYNPQNQHYVQNNTKPKKEKKYGAGIVILASVLAAVIGTVSGAAITFLARPQKTVIHEEKAQGNNININVDESAQSVVEAVAKKVTPSVVGIRTTTSVLSFFGGTQEATGDGSGVIYSSDGYIITNYHVIGDAISYSSKSKIEVFLDNLNSDSYSAEVVGYNISADLAVLKINAKGLTPIEMSDSSNLKVGQYVITIGNPGGLEFMDSVTYGVISGLNREVSANSGVPLIQTDAAINPGNSGGALVNVKGQLVGINSAKIVSEEFEGMGFAIPSNTVKEICDNIISNENAPEPYVGISISEKYTSEVLSFYGFPSGAVILSVAEKSPAENAGLQKGDIITEFNDTVIKEYTMFEDALKQCKPGEQVNIKIYRSGRYYSTKITIESNN